MGDDREEEHLSDELMDVLGALRDKDLQPLARYLRSGGLSGSAPETVAIPLWLANEIACVIEEDRLRVVGRKWSAGVKQRTLDHLVGRFVEREMARLGWGSYEAAVAAACSRFDRKRTAITEAVNRYRVRKDEEPLR